MHQPSLTIYNSRTQVPAGQVYCIGRNFPDHAKELANPVPDELVIFLKARAAIRALDAETPAFINEGLHHEAEIVVAIGSTIPFASTSIHRDQLLGIGLGLDLTRRSVQNELKKKGLPWTIAKSFFGSAIVSPIIPISDCPELDNIAFDFTINDSIRQTGHSRDMLFSIPKIIAGIAQLNPLYPGDLVFCGTPKGVSTVQAGDKFTLRFLSPAIEFSGTI